MRESKWIKQLRSDVARHNKSGSGVWSGLTLQLPLADARRLLYILDVSRKVITPDKCPANKDRALNEITGEEIYLLATGALEG